jgi:hypothetical protein
MWKALWKKWTIDKPAALGDWLWDVFVVQLGAFLDGLTLRRIIAFIPVVILVLAYYHNIPIPPELLLGVLSRAATIMFIIKRATAQIARLASGLMTEARRLDFRHRRARGTGRKRLTGRAGNEDDEPFVIGGVSATASAKSSVLS